MDEKQFTYKYQFPEFMEGYKNKINTQYGSDELIYVAEDAAKEICSFDNEDYEHFPSNCHIYTEDGADLLGVFEVNMDWMPSFSATEYGRGHSGTCKHYSSGWCTIDAHHPVQPDPCNGMQFNCKAYSPEEKQCQD